VVDAVQVVLGDAHNLSTVEVTRLKAKTDYTVVTASTGMSRRYKIKLLSLFGRLWIMPMLCMISCTAYLFSSIPSN
jgi:hypothetical protein